MNKFFKVLATASLCITPLLGFATGGGLSYKQEVKRIGFSSTFLEKYLVNQCHAELVNKADGFCQQVRIMTQDMQKCFQSYVPTPFSYLACILQTDHRTILEAVDDVLFAYRVFNEDNNFFPGFFVELVQIVDNVPVAVPAEGAIIADCELCVRITTLFKDHLGIIHDAPFVRGCPAISKPEALVCFGKAYEWDNKKGHIVRSDDGLGSRVRTVLKNQNAQIYGQAKACVQMANRVASKVPWKKH